MPVPAAGSRIPLGETKKQVSAGKTGKAVGAPTAGKAAAGKGKDAKAKIKAAVKGEGGVEAGREVPSLDRSLEEEGEEEEAVEGSTLRPLDDEEKQEENLPDKVISMQLVAWRGLGEARLAGMSADAVASEVLQLAHVRLDEERIARIDNLEALGNVTHLLLHRNRITRLENLESLRFLQLLSVASNDIMTIENLTCLPYQSPKP